MSIEIKTLTPIWTGGVNGDCDILHETGIIGSMRWWYEAIVRGLGGYACDPASDGCEFNTKGYEDARNNGKSIEDALTIGLRKVCPACQLFGCTGWKRKFRLEIENVDGKFSEGISGGFRGNFTIKIHEIRPISNNEKWLFYKNLKIIADFGAIGGRTTRKPQKGPIGQSYGLIDIDNKRLSWSSRSIYAELDKWIKENKTHLKKSNNPNWFNFKYYFIIRNDYMTRSEMNIILGLDEKGNYIKNDNLSKFLRGEEGISKKLFSFDEPKKLFGYVRNDNELKRFEYLLNKNFNNVQIEKGDDILRSLLEVDNV